MRNVQLVQELSAAGHYIIIWTARRMRTFSANVGAVIKDVGLVTLQSLSKFCIPYDEIHFGKPHGDLYVDDLAVNALVDTEKEIGWACKAAESITRGMIAARAFNSVIVVDDIVIKSSKCESISGEIYYYRSIPSSLSHLFPKVLSIEEALNDLSSISMKRVEGVSLSHLVVSHALTPNRLLNFLRTLEMLHTTGTLTAFEAAASGLNIYLNYAQKVKKRFLQSEEIYSEFPQAAVIYDFLIAYLKDYEAEERGVLAKFIHGDPVFSNVLLTSSNETVFIDMRGRVGDVYTTSGDVLYDLGKVYQSLYGYDFILLSGGNTSSAQEDYLRVLRGVFRNFLHGSSLYSQIVGTRMRDLEVITASLFFSLVPLHEKNARLSAYIEKAHLLMSRGEQDAV